jgi:phosphopantetheine adenylyltransferase
MSEDYQYQVIKFKAQIEQLKEYLAENWNDLEAEDIANIFGIETTKEIDLDVVIKGTVTVKVPMHYDTDDIRYISGEVNDISFDDSDIEVTGHSLTVTKTNEA